MSRFCWPESTKETALMGHSRRPGSPTIPAGRARSPARGFRGGLRSAKTSEPRRPRTSRPGIVQRPIFGRHRGWLVRRVLCHSMRRRPRGRALKCTAHERPRCVTGASAEAPGRRPRSVALKLRAIRQSQRVSVALPAANAEAHERRSRGQCEAGGRDRQQRPADCGPAVRPHRRGHDAADLRQHEQQEHARAQREKDGAGADERPVHGLPDWQDHDDEDEQQRRGRGIAPGARHGSARGCRPAELWRARSTGSRTSTACDEHSIRIHTSSGA